MAVITGKAMFIPYNPEKKNTCKLCEGEHLSMNKFLKIRVHVEYQTSTLDKPVCDWAIRLSDFIIYA